MPGSASTHVETAASAVPRSEARRPRHKSKTHVHRLASILADITLGGDRLGATVRHRPAHCLLDRFFALALEVSGGSGRGLAHRASTHRTRFLPAGSARAAQPTGTLVDLAHRPHPGLHLQRTRDRLYPLQPAVCGATLRGFIFQRRSKADFGVGHARSFAAENVLPGDCSAFQARIDHRR
jgi:hypothetical protein